ncbi:alpha/beta hydrolase [Amycolatopsis ultiminotia]|uniref:Alpha/beta hydrolase n=1 Tax=Amycolatopsis ultiminotia TaxID=543629 RepID=A0ABP6V4Z3_9PSEU
MATITATDEAGSVSRVPGLPDGFTDIFTSLRVDTGTVGLHVVSGGTGPALLLLPGWPQTWYAWRHLMPALATSHTVVAADPRGTGASDAPTDGYDTATLATDLAEAMTALGHRTFAAVGYDLGMNLGYALAADHPERVTRLAVGEASRGFAPPPPMIAPKPVAEKAWHFAFNRAGEISDRMVAGREEIYFGYQFQSKAAHPDAIPATAVEVYVAALRNPATRRASFEYYRDDLLDAQQAERRRTPLTIPVLGIGGAHSMGPVIGSLLQPLATDLSTASIPGAGHFLPDEAPDALLAALQSFLSTTS